MPLRIAFFVLVLTALAVGQKKNKDEITQVLDLPKDPPVVVSGDVRKLVFHVSPLFTAGLLSQQTREAVKALLKMNGGVPIIHVRAFVAGNGDIRRVPQIISDYLTEKRQPLPSISVIRAGGLSRENAQVVLESVSLAKKDVNATALEFAYSGAVTSPDPLVATRPLLDKALDQLAGKAAAAGTLQVTCFVSTLGDATGLLTAMSTRFPGAAANLVMGQRGPAQGLAACQSVRRGSGAPGGRLAFTGTRVAFGQQEKDAALAFQRLDRDLAESGANPGNVVSTNIYALSSSMAELSSRLRKATGALAVIPSEGVAAVEAGFAVDAVAALEQ
jgi:enamine deaminase RidA (YjgF/YER057c/UK114 family)